MDVYNVTMDDIFLPALFLIFISSSSCVFWVSYHSKASNMVIQQCLYLLSVISFVLQIKGSWMIDFLHQIEFVSEPILWQRRMEDFILVMEMLSSLLCAFLYFGNSERIISSNIQLALCYVHACQINEHSTSLLMELYKIVFIAVALYKNLTFLI